MNIHILTALDLSLAASLILALSITSILLNLGIGKALIVSSTRATVQLLLIGLVLKALFQHIELHWVGLMSLIMLVIATREIHARQKLTIKGNKKFILYGFSLFISSFTLTLFALLIIIQNDPWYTPRYTIPLLGMLLGNTMNGIALCTDRLNQSLYDNREIIEQRLSLGEHSLSATKEIRKDSLRSGLMPIINAMTTAGLVNLPGMMTGQILGGVAPHQAVKYQILILLLIAASTVIGVIIAVSMGTKQFFDERQRLRIDWIIHK